MKRLDLTESNGETGEIFETSFFFFIIRMSLNHSKLKKQTLSDSLKSNNIVASLPHLTYHILV